MLPRLTAWMGAASAVLVLIGGLALAGPGSTDESSSAATTQSTTGSTADDGSTTSSTSVTVPDDDQVSTTSTILVSPSTTSVTVPDDDQVSTTTSTSLLDEEAAGSVEGIFSFPAGDAGSVSVQVTDGRMFLVSTATKEGWVLEEVRAESDRVRAEFERGDDEVKLELSLEGGAIDMKLEAKSEED